MIPKADLLTLLRKETATTLRVMRAYPGHEASFRPHERSSDATGLMKTFVFETWLLGAYVFGEELNRSRFGTYAPASIDTIITDFERESLDVMERLEDLDEAKLAETVEFGGATFTKDAYLMMMLHDQIHHRGQLTVYVRMAGGKVPSIYGPSADDETTNL